MESCQARSSPLLSEFDIDKIMSKSTFTEKCVSESYLSNQDDLVENDLLSPQLSEKKRYNLRSDCETNKENVFLKISPKLSSSSLSKDISLEQNGSNFTCNSFPKDSDLNESLNVGPMLKRNVSSIRRKNLNLKVSNSSLVSKTEILAAENSSDIKTNNKGETNINIQKSQSSNELYAERKNVSIKRICTIKRQEAFLVKSQNNMKGNSTKRSDSVRNVSLETKEKLKKIQDPKNDLPSEENEVFNSLPTTPDTRHLKRTVRNASIVRGRPNSLKTGLPSDLSNGYSSGAKYNVKHRALNSTTSDNHMFTDDVNESGKMDPSLSITLQIQNIKLSSPGEDNTPEPKNEIQNSQSKGKSFLDVESVKVASKKKSYKMMSSNSDSKIHKMKTRSSSKVTRVHSFPEPTIRKSKVNKAKRSPSARKSKDKKRIESFKERDVKEIKKNSENKENAVLPEITINTPNDIFKTPRTKYETPEVWYSGREFLDAERSREGDVSNKRESIAMIRKNKKGHVMEKINLFDSNTSSDTPSQLHSKVTRTASLYSPACKQMVKMPQKCSSSVKSNRSARNRYSPLPPPPKFIIPDSPPKQSFPLKVLFDTNVSNSDGLLSPSPAKLPPPTKSTILDSLPKESFPLKVLFDANVSNSDTFLSPSPAKTPIPALKDLSVEKSLKNCSLKPKRNSYSGHTPYKLPKRRNKVLRSESSPMISNLNQLSGRIALNM